MLLVTFMVGCGPVRFVDVQKKHNYYQRHRYNTYTAPTWVPGFGVMLETHVYRNHRNITKAPIRRKR